MHVNLTTGAVPFHRGKKMSRNHAGSTAFTTGKSAASPMVRMPGMISGISARGGAELAGRGAKAGATRCGGRWEEWRSSLVCTAPTSARGLRTARAASARGPAAKMATARSRIADSTRPVQTEKPESCFKIGGVEDAVVPAKVMRVVHAGRAEDGVRHRPRRVASAVRAPPMVRAEIEEEHRARAHVGRHAWHAFDVGAVVGMRARLQLGAAVGVVHVDKRHKAIDEPTRWPVRVKVLVARAREARDAALHVDVHASRKEP
mmetsp:Transcript_8994/g.28261  ORF Transcript_8994/g.28261 Transcript_8994/m.28261 type:complete len:261 (-) Transcript_8994:388-1170(-)